MVRETHLESFTVELREVRVVWSTWTGATSWGGEEGEGRWGGDKVVRWSTGVEVKWKERGDWLAPWILV